jgi:hypothetical protein
MKIRHVSIFTVLLALVLVFGSVFAASVDPIHIPGASNTDKTCAVLYPDTPIVELKIEPVPDGSYSESDGVLTVHIVKPSILAGSLNSFDWTANITVMGVVVKNGVDGANFYDYSPTGSTGDTYLTTPFDGAKAISHISFCYYPPEYQPLEVEKTAEASYDRTVEWELEKYVDPDSHEGYAGEEAGTSIWTVIATKTEIIDNYFIEGTITITNPNDYPVDFSVVDELDDGTLADVSCPTYTVPANDYVVCTYEAYPDDDSAEWNTATVSVDGEEDVVATAEVDFIEILIGYDEGTLSDPRFGFEELISQTTEEEFEEIFVCPTDVSLYEDGVYVFDEENTAYLNDNIDLEASAAVTITCYLPEELTVTKTAVTSYAREHMWDIAKKVETEFEHELDGYPKIWLYIDGSGDETATWTIDVTYEGFLDSDFNVSGVITIENTGYVDAVITDIVDILADTPIDIDCDVEFPYTLPFGETLTCYYDEDVDGFIEGYNEVTVTTLVDDYYAEAEIIWGDPDPEYHATVNVYDQSDLFGLVHLGTVYAPDDAQFTYTEDFAWEDYGADLCGPYMYYNIAKVIGDNNTVLANDTAALKVNVQCIFYEYETAFAKGDDAICFIPTFSNWGWTNPILPGTYEMELWAAAGQCDTDNGMLVGYVTVVYDEDGYVTVEYELFAGYILEETHVYAGTTMFPLDRRGRPTVAPGQYYNDSPFDGSEVYVIAHAVVGIGMPDPGFGPLGSNNSEASPYNTNLARLFLPAILRP